MGSHDWQSLSQSGKEWNTAYIKCSFSLCLEIKQKNKNIVSLHDFIGLHETYPYATWSILFCLWSTFLNCICIYLLAFYINYIEYLYLLYIICIYNLGKILHIHISIYIHAHMYIHIYLISLEIIQRNVYNMYI